MELPKSTSEVVESIKQEIRQITDADLGKAYETALQLAEKFNRTGQLEAARILYANTNTFKKEQWLIEHGYDRYFLKGFLDELTEDERDHVYFVELSRFERPLPEEAIKAVEETRDIFDVYFVLYTDYTDKEDRKIEAENRERDPILFGMFKTVLKEERNNREYIGRRCYVLAEWEDDWCDLKMDEILQKYDIELGECKLPDNLEELEKKFVEILPSKKEEDEGQD